MRAGAGGSVRALQGGAVGTGRVRGWVVAGPPVLDGFILLFFRGEAPLAHPQCPLGRTLRVSEDSARAYGIPLCQALVCGRGGGLELSADPALRGGGRAP